MSVFRSLLMLSTVMPEPDIYPYLLAGKSGKKLIKLMASKLMPLYYLNTPQILENTLDNKNIGTDKFSFSFKINKSSITDGTKYILNYPGLVDVKSEDNTLWFKFLFEENPNWKYIDQNELIDDWNTIKLSSDGSIISLIINNTKHIIIDSTVHWTPWEQPVLNVDDWNTNSSTFYNGKLSGFEFGNYTTKNGTFHWGMDSQTYYLSGTYGTPFNMFQQTDVSDKQPFFHDFTNEELTFFNRNLWQGMSANWSSDRECPWFYNPKSTLRLKSIDIYQGWTYYPWTYTSMPITTRKAKIYTDGTKKELINEVEISDLQPGTKVTIDCNNTEVEYIYLTTIGDDTTFSQKGNSSSIISRIEIHADVRVDGDVYPELSTGKLTLVQPWTVLKDVEAQFLGNVEPPTPVDPDPEPTYDDEGAPVSAKDLPKGWAMWKCIVDYEDTYNPNSNWYRYTTNIPYIDDENIYHGSGDVYSMPDKSSPAATARSIYLGSTDPGTSQWEYYTELSYNYYEAKLIRNRIND